MHLVSLYLLTKVGSRESSSDGFLPLETLSFWNFFLSQKNELLENLSYRVVAGFRGASAHDENLRH